MTLRTTARTLLLLAALSASLLPAATLAPAFAQDLTIKAPAKVEQVRLINARIFPVSGPPIERGYIDLADGKITAIGAGDPSAAPDAGVTVVDIAGGFVYPGMIDPYSQIGLTEIQAVAATIDSSEAAAANIAPEVCPAIAINPDSTLFPVTRSNGVLLAGVFPVGGTIPGQVSVIRFEGWTAPNMTARAKSGVVLQWPQMRAVSAWWMETSEEEQLKSIRESLTRIEQVFDTAQAYARQKSSSTPADPATPTDLRWEAMQDLFSAQDQSAPRLYVLANDLDQIQAAVAFCIERGMRPVIVGGRDAPLAAELLNRHNVGVIIQGVFALPRRADAPYDDAYTLAKRLADANIPFAISNADDTAHSRNLPYEAAMAAAHGLPQDLALRAITLTAAELLGVGDTYGSLEVGKSATLFVATGNIMDVRSRVTRAFIDGKPIDLSNKQTKLEEKYRTKYRQMGLIPGADAK